jgi:LmbE family N-acetylglucosaminyl deacetylase
MVKLHLERASRILCMGAHPDDIEIGCGGTILHLLEANPDSEICWVVFSGTEDRSAEARESAAAFLGSAGGAGIRVEAFRESYFPYQGTEIKECFESLKSAFSPDLVLSHHRRDLHQDHRLIAELTWNTFRDHLILEYEVPKWDGDLGAPNVFVPLSEAVCQQKVQNLFTHFVSQRPRDWFTEDTFLALMRLRGMECRSPSRYAEAFYAPKLVLDPRGQSS